MSSFVVFAVACALFLRAVESSHFYGTTINWHDASHGGTEVVPGGTLEINFRIAWRGDTSEAGCDDQTIADQSLLGSTSHFRCLSNDCGSQFLGSLKYICTSFSTLDRGWATGGNSFDHTFPVTASKKNFVIGNDFDRMTGLYHCCWVETRNAANGDIRFRTEISFEPRTDNNQINQSPVTDMVPLLPARVGCEFKMIIPNVDPDFDDVKCRWARSNDDNELDECGSACIDRNFIETDGKSYFNATLVEEECEIIWIPRVPGQYAAAVQLEDFYPSDVARTNPLSSIPLQWLIEVAPSTTPCAARPFFPPQTHIPREQPRCFAVPDGGNLTLKIFVEHTAHPINNVTERVVVLPRGMSATQLFDEGNGRKSVTFAWTPDAEQAGRPHFLCFMFLDEVRAPTDLICYTVVTSVDQPKVLLNTRSPTEAGETGFNAIASITFTEEVTHPTVSPRYISVVRVSDGHVIQRIDTSMKSKLNISADFKTISFRLDSQPPYLFEKGAEYEIVVEEGAVVGRAASCSGGGPVAEGVVEGQWRFTSAGPPDECVAGTHNCHDNARCDDLPDGFTCTCKDGYTGDGVINCDDIDECKEELDNCHANATCTNTPGSFECDCKAGFTGDGVSCVDIDECTLMTDDCHGNADCHNLPGSFSCTCKPGFEGDGKNCVDIDECARGLDDECSSIQTCVNTIGDYNCTCMKGYKVDEANTVDPTRPVCIDCNECLPECPEAIDEECHEKATCQNVVGSYNCNCMAGYEPDATSGKPANRPVCINIDECTRNTDDCDVNADCTDTPGSFTCTCRAGYEGDGKTCRNIDECARGSDNCHDKAVCSDTDGSFDCTCMLGYKPDGSGAPANRPVCVDCNECLGECPASIADKGACHVNADCTNIPGSFNCTCKDGYEASAGSPPNRPVCVNIDECARRTDTCHAMATCVDTAPPLKFDCVCKQGYKPGPGSAPNRPVCVNCDECTPGDCPVEPNPFCDDNAMCTDMPGSFECECNAGFEGDGFTCIDVTNCTDNWPIIRDRWIGEEDEWVNGTDECPRLGDRLPEPTFQPSEPPIDQWDDLRDNFVDSLKAWLATASRIPGMPSDVPDVSGLDPDAQWEALKNFEDDLYDVWYKQVGEPNGFFRPTPTGECDDKRLQLWNHFIQTSQDAQEKYEMKFGDRCDGA